MILKSVKSFLAGCLIVAGLTMNLGMRFAGDPGDCIVPDDAAFASVDGGCKDLATGRVWSLQPDTNWSFDNASKYCGDLVEGGQTDWRMPTIDELKAVYAHGGSSHLRLTQLTPANWSSSSIPGKNYYGLRFS